MSEGGAAGTPFPIRFADIVFAHVLDPNGRNPKIRRVVVLTPDDALAAGFPIVVAGVTGTLPDPLTADYVKLPYKNPPGRHPKTGLTKDAAVLCSWIVPIAPDDIHGRSGFVPPALMAIVHSKTAAMARAIGGWT
jgi:mRNA-degrading endonuclease toxin of MazEF toxin-antitoxin module